MADAESAPIPMLLTCPVCAARHIDLGRFATHPHHTHSCQGCGHTWRPAIVATVGVAFLPGFKDAEVEIGQPISDDAAAPAPGVIRVIVDGRSLVLRLGLHRIVHDLHEDADGREAVCTTCLGLGLVKCDSAYRPSDRAPQWDDPFPLHHQYLMPCPHCYMGHATICRLCDKPMDRGRTECQCPAAFRARVSIQQAKELERRAKLPHVALAEYKLDMLWCDECDEYVSTDYAADHRADRHDAATFFACVDTPPPSAPLAASVLEVFQFHDDVHAEVDTDNGDILDYKEGHEAALQKALDAWGAEYVTVNSLYFADMNLIVDVPAEPDEDEDTMGRLVEEPINSDPSTGEA